MADESPNEPHGLTFKRCPKPVKPVRRQPFNSLTSYPGDVATEGDHDRALAAIASSTLSCKRWNRCFMKNSCDALSANAADEPRVRVLREDVGQQPTARGREDYERNSTLAARLLSFWRIAMVSLA